LGFERLGAHAESVNIGWAAKAAACDSYGQAKQGKQGKGKEKVG